jgi:hypothetical protein
MSAQLVLPLEPCCRIDLGHAWASWYDAAGRRHVEHSYPRCVDAYWRVFA